MLAEPIAVAIGLDRWPAVCNWLATTQVGVRPHARASKGLSRKGYIICPSGAVGQAKRAGLQQELIEVLQLECNALSERSA